MSHIFRFRLLSRSCFGWHFGVILKIMNYPCMAILRMCHKKTQNRFCATKTQKKEKEGKGVPELLCSPGSANGGRGILCSGIQSHLGSNSNHVIS